MVDMDIAVIESRRYRLHPGARDELISLFEREFIEPQEAAGAAVLGQFRDLDDPDRFVWLRGFTGMRARHAALEAFYGGPVWKEHRGTANRTMIAWDDVLLLRPAGPMTVDTSTRPPLGSPAPPTTFHLTVRYLDAPVRSWPVTPGTLVSSYEDNDFPALPVRTGVHAVVSYAGGERAEDGTPPAGHTERMRLSPTPRSFLR